ncbi:thymidylate synthase [Chitinophagaceae bacterium LB-8]|uniref:Thymidylate synthase n=1 Tax=Paraflavisolibacter caeni TaxID=2982496 RepID=A0A9X3BIA8_9BACT|nr:thymidylate synthase [Paraflavisolibacter caeni]MCU7549818.1 thymidylate synthase [Paraflavisolibacter caeni]
MYIQEFDGINSFLIGIARLLLNNGESRVTRNFETVELNHPIIIKIKNPLSRLVTLKERNWNHVLPYAESLWISSGRNDMGMIGSYLKKMYDFSDDNISMRAAYGPRLRYFSGVPNDYENNLNQKSIKVHIEKIIEVDQFSFIEKVFKKDPYTRQGIISITDPAKDYFDNNYELKKTKDFPCTNNIQFLRRDNSLDVITHMRSNDFFWGASAVNIFNFTFIQEYFAKILGLDVGYYYHIVNNLHYYKDFQKKVETIANLTECKDDYFAYKKSFNNLAEFDARIAKLEKFEDELRKSNTKKLITFDDDFFDDWAKVLFAFHTKQPSIKFSNPLLNELHERKQLKAIH